MVVLGIDLGAASCVLATPKRTSVLVITNEISERSIPSMVLYSEKERFFGELAKTQQRKFLGTTCRYVKHLIGITENDVEDFNYEKQYSFVPLAFASEEEAKLAGYEVNVGSSSKVITATACLASLLVRLKDTAEASLKTRVKDVVISVPSWYSDKARQNVVDAASIANLKCLRTFNEHAAIALDYGTFRRNSFKDDEQTRVAFVNVGHGSTTISVVDFTKSKLKVVAVEHDKHLGGRDFDRAISAFLIEIFKQQNKIDCSNMPKAIHKLEEISAKIKTVLNVNAEYFVNETVINDYDINLTIKREQLETICAEHKQKLINLLNKVFLFNSEEAETSKHKIPLSTLHSIEIVGGCTRIIWIQDLLSGLFQKPLSRTLNAEETVARGCAIIGASYIIESENKFDMTDILLDPVTVSFYAQTTDVPELKTSVLFDKYTPLGVRKSIKFHRHQAFDIQLTPGVNGSSLLSRIEVPSEGVQNDLPKLMKLGARLTLNGTVHWDEASLIVDEYVEDENQETTDPVSAEAEADQVPKAPKKLLKPRTYNCTLVSQPRPGYLEPHIIEKLRNAETEEINKDMLRRQVLNSKNDLETYIYNMKNRLCESLSKYVAPEEHDNLSMQLSSSIDWLYNVDPLEETKELYLNKFSELKDLCEPVAEREREYNHFISSQELLYKVISDLENKLNSPEYADFCPVRAQTLRTKSEETRTWLDRISSHFFSQPLYQIQGKIGELVAKEVQLFINFSKMTFEAAQNEAQPSPPPTAESAEQPRTEEVPVSNQTDQV